MGREKYVQCEFPEEASASLIASGAKPIKAIVWLRSDRVAYGMLSDDPSGDNGEIERHLSVSASSRGIGRRMPTGAEVYEAAKAVGMDIEKCDISKHKLGVHLFTQTETQTEIERQSSGN